MAIGGNAILRKGQKATMENQMNNLRDTCSHIATMVKAGYSIVLTHGNGPQVGDILLQNELSKKEVPPMPLDVCVAQSQGQIGYMLQQALTEALRRIGMKRTVTCVLTRVVVDENDEAFLEPTKPIGPYYSRAEAGELERKGWRMSEDIGRGGFRRVVPSPRPVSIVEAHSIRRLIQDGSTIVIAAGGGGIPMIIKSGQLCGVEAVIDKDLAASALALGMRESRLVMLTDVDMVYLNYGKEDQRPLGSVTVTEMERFLGEGQFPAGSMGPKVEAAIRFVRGGGDEAIITQPQCLDKALTSKAGTHIALR